jgi:DNA-directed RNA polymerase specialized sigma24 family protein
MINRPLPDKPLFTPQEAATKLNMSIKTLMSHIYAGRLRFINI